MNHNRFQDHFSGHAEDYASYRPRYPDALFAWLAEQTPAKQAAWDCATGSGQAATALATYFKTVIATDASPQQIENATPYLGVEYRVAAAEKSGLRANSIDLVTVGQALHWFDLPAFYREVNRVLKPGGVIAVWMYIPIANRFSRRFAHSVCPMTALRLLAIAGYYLSSRLVPGQTECALHPGNLSAMGINCFASLRGSTEL